LGNVTFKIGPTRLDWATISMTALDGAGFDRPGRILIAATGWTQNQDAKLEALGDHRVTLRDRWGRGPVLCEGITASITLPVPPERVKCYPLDESGNRRSPIPVAAENGHARIELAPQHKTVWYEVEARAENVAVGWPPLPDRGKSSSPVGWPRAERGETRDTVSAASPGGP
jgi:hypothetical protein